MKSFHIPGNGPPVVERILVADDDLTTRLLLSAALKREGFAVECAADGDAAMALWQQQRHDLVLLDVEMPRANGFEVCRRIRAVEDAPAGQVPIVMVTGMDDTDSVTHAYEVGATDFIAKPINLASLGHRVRYVLRASRTMAQLRQAEARTLAMLSAIPDLILRLGPDGTILGSRMHGTRGETALPDQPGAMRETGIMTLLESEQMHGRRLPDLLDARAGAVLMDRLRACFASGQLQLAEFSTGQAGRREHFEARLAAIGHAETLCVIRDISERREADERIRLLAYRDPLTGMMNRHAVLEALETLLRQRSAAADPLAVLFIDLDGFKRINDTLGHVVGDHVLQAVAERLRSSTRLDDGAMQGGAEPMLARLGGDEFTIVLPGVTGPEQAMAVAHRLREDLRRPFVVNSHEVGVTSSIGIAMFPADGDDSGDLLKYADTAMYHAKETGRNNCKLYSSSLTTRITQRVTLENSLRRAIERQEFTLVYQPQLHWPSGRVVGMEALIRWNHPERGLVPPADFIPMAEESGLIVPIGDWVLRTACAQLRHWLDAGLPSVRMAVNVSAMQFRDEDLLASILEILATHGLLPEQLDLELTESTLMDNVDSTIETLVRFNDAGVCLSIDDFGTGYSSMSYLKRFPVRALKIDRSFVADLPHDRENAGITRAIIAMADSLGLEVVAEGIETPDQAKVLEQYGCSIMQGYYFSRPMSAEMATTWLSQHQPCQHAGADALQAG
jgi:diguanylate cyclase (GGDEF)-like protein